MDRRVLLTGATGYIGGRLLRRFEEAGRPVRCLARDAHRVDALRSTTEVVQGDCLDEASLDVALAGVESAYYLVHSMNAGADFEEVDRQAASNFGRAAARAGVRRIVYLGGLVQETAVLSSHLRSRAETGAILRASGVAVVEFKASIVIGAGSLSFQMIEALVERLPLMVCPRWVSTPTQPIGVDDVVAYLQSALDRPVSGNEVFEIGGPDVVSYGEIMKTYAGLRGLRRWLVPVPLLTPHLSGLWLALVTPAQARVGRALVEGLRNPTVVRSPPARDAFGITPMSLREACLRAIDEGALRRHMTDTRLLIVHAPPAQVFAPIRRIGGDTGWYFGDALWRLRGWLDACVGGTGMPRRRRDPDSCAVDDVIDGWKVEAYEPDRLLRLAAGLKLPGRGWLEFHVAPLGAGERSLIRQTATFDPKGVMGRFYWYLVLPLHALIFRGLLRRIARRAVAIVTLAAAAALPVTSAAQTSEPRTVAFVDLDRYAGEWLELARLPNRFQDDCVGDVRASYARRPDGRLDVVNQCRTAAGPIQARGIARVVDMRTFARLKVRFAPAWLGFLPMVWGDYWVIGLAEDYSWAVVGSPDRQYLWILARTPRLDEQRSAAARGVARANGFDLKRLIETPR